MWKYKDNISYNVAVIGLALAIAVNFVTTGFPAKIFYILTYVAMFYSVKYVWMNRHEALSDKLFISFLGSVFFIGLIRVVWGLWFRDNHFDDVLDNYLLGGKRFVLSVFLIFWLYKERVKLQTYALTIAAVILVIGMVMTVWYGYEAHHLNGERIKLTADAATTTAYLIVILSFTTLWICLQRFQNTMTSVVLFVFVMVMTLFLLTLTGTRSAVLSAPLFFLAYFIFNFRAVPKKIKYGFILFCLAGILVTPWLIQNRMKQITQDISEYNTNNDTSIGARFSIWESGMHSIKPTLLGQTPASRTEKARAFIEKYERNNPEAYNNVKYNLHNETLEVLSLQGILGLLSLFMLFVSSIVYGIKGIRNNSNGVFFIMCPIIIMGLTDTVMIQSNTALMICVALALCQVSTTRSKT